MAIPLPYLAIPSDGAWAQDAPPCYGTVLVPPTATVAGVGAAIQADLDRRRAGQGGSLPTGSALTPPGHVTRVEAVAAGGRVLTLPPDAGVFSAFFPFR